ncbi:MAG: hypothetical protein H2038_04995 [Brevundimonas sp.]|jgi:hypothetical protein|uniref:hypothetical protein n=1 Tax=Brevundimonas sp. TaxID=1871086 RepID=UPI001845651A|nr:hypothetical protein [Brevundimonas sp.]MBA4803992.1 hypothetical protein [Brevundimonas sp.]
MSNVFLRLGVLFAVVGVSLGYWMGATHQFTVSPVHAHINLLGWVSMFLYGLFYRSLPAAADGWLPKAHLALAGLGLPVMMIGLTIQLLAVPGLVAWAPPMMIVGPTMVVLGMFVFALIVFRATGPKAAAAA